MAMFGLCSDVRVANEIQSSSYVSLRQVSRSIRSCLRVCTEWRYNIMYTHTHCWVVCGRFIRLPVSWLLYNIVDTHHSAVSISPSVSMSSLVKQPIHHQSPTPLYISRCIITTISSCLMCSRYISPPVPSSRC